MCADFGATREGTWGAWWSGRLLWGPPSGPWQEGLPEPGSGARVSGLGPKPRAGLPLRGDLERGPTVPSAQGKEGNVLGSSAVGGAIRLPAGLSRPPSALRSPAKEASEV